MMNKRKSPHEEETKFVDTELNTDDQSKNYRKQNKKFQNNNHIDVFPSGKKSKYNSESSFSAISRTNEPNKEMKSVYKQNKKIKNDDDGLDHIDLEEIHEKSSGSESDDDETDNIILDNISRNEIDLDNLEKTRAKMRSGFGYHLQETETRNVIFLGRTRTGKSTAVGVLKDICYDPKPMSIFSDTVNAKFQSFGVEGKNGKKYTLNIIDIPGLFEQKINNNNIRSNDDILKLINDCQRNEITKLHCAIIFANFEAGINSEDIKSIELFQEKFNGVEIYLCITKCELKPSEFMKRLLDELTKKLTIKRANILFTGCVNLKDTGYNNSEVEKVYHRVGRMRELIFEKIFRCDKFYNVRDLILKNDGIKHLEKLCKDYTNILSRLMVVKDFDLSESKMLLNNIEDIQHDMRRYLSIFNDCDGIQEAMNKAKEFRLQKHSNTEILNRCINVFNYDLL
jgi:GTP-binding protein EngB required for normal cell division